jgi:hypothetical protein
MIKTHASLFSVNGENAVSVTDEELAELRKYEADGFIELRNK